MRGSKRSSSVWPRVGDFPGFGIQQGYACGYAPAPCEGRDTLPLDPNPAAKQGEQA